MFKYSHESGSSSLRPVTEISLTKNYVVLSKIKI